MAWVAGTAFFAGGCDATGCDTTGGGSKVGRLGFANAGGVLVDAAAAVLTVGLVATGFVVGREISCLLGAVTWSSGLSVRVGAEARTKAVVGAGVGAGAGAAT